MARARRPASVQGSPCKFQIPLTDNAGQPFDPQVFVEIKQTAERVFNGFTVLGVREGSYQGQVESSLWVEVLVPPHRIEEFRELVRAIGKELGQRAMYVEIPPPCAEIIPVADQGG